MPTETNLPELTGDDLRRYGRHLVLSEVGPTGQRKLKASKVLLVGAGGLGSPAALYLAAAGVGTLGLVDFDVVDITNLHRQVIHGTKDIGRPKLDSASDRIRDVNPNVHVVQYDTALTSANALEIARGYDVIVDGTDNFPTRYLVNDTCVLLGKPNAFGSVLKFEGQASVFATDDGPCYRCLFREPPAGLVPSCAEAGVLGVLPGIVGTIQATEAIKLILGVGDSLIGRLLLIDALSMQFRTIQVRRDPECPACGTRELKELIDYDAFCGVSGNGQHAAEDTIYDISPKELAERIRRGDDFQLIDVREEWEWQIAQIPGARLIPLGSIEDVAATLDPKRDVVLYCKSGVRSLHAAEALAEAGFTKLGNLSGGILRWSQDVDPTVVRY